MHYCNICGTGDAYEGLNVVECVNQDCKNFSQKQLDAVALKKKKPEQATIKDAENNLQKFKEAYGYPAPLGAVAPVKPNKTPEERLNAFEEFLAAKKLSNETFKNEYYAEPGIMDKKAPTVTSYPIADTTNISQFNIDYTKRYLNQLEEEILNNKPERTVLLQRTYWELKKHLKKYEHTQELSECQKYYTKISPTGRKPSEPDWQWHTDKGILDLYTQKDVEITKKLMEWANTSIDFAGMEKELAKGPEKAKTDECC